MRCGELTEKLEETWPRSLAESWDNVGLLAGRSDRETETVMLAVDATDEVVDEAVRRGADLLLTHHPLIFSPRKRINDDDFIGRRLLKLLRHDICYYAMHTNFDVVTMAEAAADRIGLADRRVLDVTREEGDESRGIGRYGRLPETASLESWSGRVKAAFGLDRVKIFGDLARQVSFAAICPGSGKSVIEKAARMGADVLITGDIGHHEGIDALAMGLCIIDGGHYGLEQIFVPYMEEYLQIRWSGLHVLRAKEKIPFRIL